jgi:regulator of sigma E protease
MIMFTWGSEKLPVQNAIYGYQVDSVMMEMGFKDGDMPIRFGDEKPVYYSDLAKTLILADKPEVEVLRDGNAVVFTLPEGWRDRLLEDNIRGLFTPILPFFADTILPSGTAINSDLQKGDRIVGINNISTPWFYSFASEIRQFKGQEIQLAVIRNSDTIQFPVNVSDDGLIGVGPGSPSNYFESETIHYTFFQAIPAGIKHGYVTLTSYASSLKLLFTKSGAKQMGGFGTIGNLFPATWDWQTFWNLTAFISIILAFMNILPIPALDGGHAVFIIYEMLTGRTPNQKVLEYAQMVGMFLLLALVLFANANDIYKFFFK